jgi:hypothetical protein
LSAPRIDLTPCPALERIPFLHALQRNGKVNGSKLRDTSLPALHLITGLVPVIPIL